MSDEKPKAGPGKPSGIPPGGPPKLERVPTGYRPPPTVRPAPATARPPPAVQPPSPPAPPSTAPSGAPPSAGADPSAPPPAAPGASRGLAAREVGADAAMAAGLAHEGSLGRESALRLFGLAAALRASGLLTLSPEGRTFSLVFRRGTVEHAASTDAEDDLGRFLVRRGALSEEDRRRAEEAAGGPDGDLAAALVEQRLVNPADVAALLQEHGATVVQRALAAEAGGWSWSPAVAPPPSSFPLGPPFGMLVAAVRALDSASLLRRLGERERLAAARVGGRIRVEDLRLAPQEARVAGLFDGVRSPAELAAASPADAIVVLRLALLLVEVDLLAFGAPRRGAPPAGAAQGPARSDSTATAPVAAPTRPASAAGAPSRSAPAPTPDAGRGQAPRAPASGRPPPRAAPASPPRTPAPRPAATAPAAPSPAGLDAASLGALVKRLSAADHFEALGVKRDASSPQIKVAYLRLAKTYHPDAVPADASPDVRKLAADVFARVSDAWSVIGEDSSRAAYREELESGGAAGVDVMGILEAERIFEAATLLVKARRYHEALRKLDEALALNPEEAEFAIWKGFCEFLLAADKKRKLPASAAAIEAALKRNPRCAQGYLFLGQMAKVTGDLGLAERHLQRGLKVAPDHPDLLRELKYLRK